VQGRSQDCTLGATEAERRRRENRCAKGVWRREKWGLGRGCPPPQPTMGSRGASHFHMVPKPLADQLGYWIRTRLSFKPNVTCRRTRNLWFVSLWTLSQLSDVKTAW